MAGPSFKQLEQAGWTARAAAYDAWFGRITSEAIAPTLDRLGDLTARSFIDISCGTGHLAGAAAARGARVVGIDFADTMVQGARANHPGLDFRLGDAEALDFPDGAFEAAACGFGILHFGDPDRALAEAFRVLAGGGHYAFSVWCGPEQGNDLFRLVLEAIEAHGTMDVDLPPAPPWFRFADGDECRRVLAAVGFADIVCETLELVWRPAAGAEVLEMIHESIVRTPMLLERQTPDARERIHTAIAEGAERLRSGPHLQIRMPAILTSARKPN